MVTACHTLVIMSHFTTMQIWSEYKLKKKGSKLVYGEDLRSLTSNTKNRGNNHLSRRFERCSFWYFLPKSLTKICLCCIPFFHFRQYRLLKLVVGRLRDRSSNVRKHAVQLLTILLQCNPYNSSLPVEDIKEQVKIGKNPCILLPKLFWPTVRKIILVIDHWWDH